MIERTALAPPLGTRFARGLLVVFVLVHAILSIGPGPTAPVVRVLALIAVGAAAALVVLPRGHTLDLVPTIAAVVLATAGTALVVPGLPADGWPGYASWPIGAATMVAIGLALRSRGTAAWALMIALAAVCVLWALHGGAPPAEGLTLIERQVGVLVIGSLFAMGLRRAAASVGEFAVVQRQQTLERDLAETELRARGDAVAHVLDEAGPILTQIASGAQLDSAQRARITALEGRLRDEIALGPLLSETLDAALASARRRGVDVVVLTEPSVGDLPASVRLRAANWLADHLDDARGPDFVGRVLPRGSGVRVSAAADQRIENGLLEDDEV